MFGLRSARAGPARAAEHSATATAAAAAEARAGIRLGEEMQLVEEMLGGGPGGEERSWDERVRALKMLRAITGSEAVRLGSGLSAEREEYLRSLRRLGPLLAAQVGDLRSVVVKETCACIGFMAASLGDVFAECVGDDVMPALLRARSVTIAVISTSSLEAATKILSYARNGISAYVVEHLTQVLRSRREPAMRRAAAAEYIGLLLVDSVDNHALERTLEVVEAAIGGGCLDPVERVRALSRANWRRLEAAAPKRASVLLETLPPSTRALILEEKRLEMDAEPVPVVHPGRSRPAPTRSAARRVLPPLFSPSDLSSCSTSPAEEAEAPQSAPPPTTHHARKAPQRSARRLRFPLSPFPRSFSQETNALSALRDRPRQGPQRPRRVSLAPALMKPPKHKQQKPVRAPRRSILPALLTLGAPADLDENQPPPPPDAAAPAPKASAPQQQQEHEAEEAPRSPPLRVASAPASPTTSPTVEQLLPFRPPRHPPVSPDPPTPAPNGPKKSRLSFLLNASFGSWTVSAREGGNGAALQELEEGEETSPLTPPAPLDPVMEQGEAGEEDVDLTSIAEAMIEMSLSKEVINPSSCTIESSNCTEQLEAEPRVGTVEDVETVPKGEEENKVNGRATGPPLVAQNSTTRPESPKVLSKEAEARLKASARLRDALQRTAGAKGWEERVRALKMVSEACRGLSGHALDFSLASKTLRVVGDLLGESHFRVASAALDAVFDLLLNVEAPARPNGARLNPLQGAMEKHWTVLRRILARLGDAKEHIRSAAGRVMHAFAVQFEPEVRVSLVIRALNAGGASGGSGANGALKPKLVLAGLRAIGAAFTGAKAAGSGFIWQVATLEALVALVAPLLRDRRLELRTAAAAVARQMAETAPAPALQLAARDLAPSHRAALLRALGVPAAEANPPVSKAHLRPKAMTVARGKPGLGRRSRSRVSVVPTTQKVVRLPRAHTVAAAQCLRKSHSQQSLTSSLSENSSL